MNQFLKIVGAGMAAILVFDIAASFASKGLGFPYSYASFGSMLIYASVGYFSFLHFRLSSAIGAAVLVGLVDATLGWFISWQIGPGALPAEQASTIVIVTTIVFVIIFAAVCTVIGSAVARILHGSRIETNA